MLRCVLVNLGRSRALAQRSQSIAETEVVNVIRFNASSAAAQSKSDDVNQKSSSSSDAASGSQDEAKDAPSADVSALREEKEKLVTENAELKDKYRRALAETENVRTRLLKQIEDAKQFAIQGFSKDLLELADVLPKAMESLPAEMLKKQENKELRNLHEGLQMIQSQLIKVFRKNGLVALNPLGEKFDPNFHEAIFEIPDATKEAGTVGHVVKTGYMIHERPLRPAQVGVIKKP